MSESIRSKGQNQSQETSINLINNNNNIIISNSKPVEQELVFILENGTDPIPVRTIKKPEPQLHSPVHVPFPPAINAADLIRTNKNGALLARCTNKFLIYRNEFAREVRAQGHNLSMSEISCLAAQAWKQEPNYVIKKYADIAHEVKWLHKYLSRSNSRNKKKDSLDSSHPPSSEVDDDDKIIYNTQQKKTSHLFTQQSSNDMFHLNNLNHHQKNNLSPLISSPLTPLTPTMFSSTFMYQPRISEVVTSNIPLNTVSMISPSSREESHNVYPNLGMVSPFEFSFGYCGEPFPTMSSNWIYASRQ